MTSPAGLTVQAVVVLLVAYGGAFARVRVTRDLLDLPALVVAITGSLFALPALSLAGSRDGLFQVGAPGALSRVLLVVLAALIAFLVAVWARDRRDEGGHVATPAARFGDPRIVWGLCAVALVCAAAMQIGADAIIGRTTNPLAVKSTDQLPWWYFFAQGGLSLSQLAFWLALADSLAPGGRLRSWTVLGSGALALALSFTQGRMMLVGLVIPAALLIHHHRRRITVAALAGAVVVALTYFLVWDHYREQQVGARPSGLGASPAGVWKGITNNLDYSDSFIRLVLARPRYAYGETYLAPATKPVPRSVWAGKPLGGNSRLTEIILPGTLDAGYSRAASAVTEAYLNFGPVGPVLLYALLGVVCAALAAWHRRRSGAPEATLWFGIAVLCLLTFVRTDAQIATTFLGYYAIPLGLIALLRGARLRLPPPRGRRSGAVGST